MKLTFLIITMLAALNLQAQRTLLWHDEFDTDGAPNPEYWNNEQGFVRNHEFQWYQPQNATITGGILTIQGRLDSIPNPRYRAVDSSSANGGNRRGGNDWKQTRPYAQYSSSSINTRGKFEFLYGRLEVRARIPAVVGSWPAIWLLGSKYGWPSCGEIDVMEYYHVNGRPHILANACWGNDQNGSVWNSKRIPYQHFLDKDPYWNERFHIWVMDWTPDYIRIYLDDELLNDIDLSKTVNGRAGGNENPFHTPQYILLNLAIGGDNGGEPVPNAFPMNYEIDYVRVYAPEK